MKLFLHINAKKIETVISYFDNYLWNVGIQIHRLYIIFLSIYQVKCGFHPTRKRVGFSPQIYNLPIRQTRYVDENYFPARCEFYKDGVSFETFKEICSTEGYDTVELVCHPALVDERLMNVSSYNMNRIKELELLKSDAFKQFIKDHDIQIISYADIKNN